MSDVETLTFDEFSAAGEAWDDLVRASAYPLPFLTHSWVCQWWRHFGEGMEFLAPVLREGDRWLAGVPLGVRRSGGLAVVARVAEIVGTAPVPTRGMGLADKADLVVRAEAEDAREKLIAALVDLLSGIDVLDLKGVDSESPTGDALRAAAGESRVRMWPRSRSPFLRLEGTWDDYLMTRSRPTRKHLKKDRRVLLEQPGARIARMEAADDCGEWMSQVFAVNERSWSAQRGTNLYRHPELRKFFAAVVAELHGHGLIDLRMAWLDGRAVAYELCFDLGGRLFSYNSSFDEESRSLSPGSVVTTDLIEDAFHRGRDEYDILRGDEAYKSQWSQTARSEDQLMLLSGSLSSRGYARAHDAKTRLKSCRWAEDLDDRLSGLLSRLRHRGGAS